MRAASSLASPRASARVPCATRASSSPRWSRGVAPQSGSRAPSRDETHRRRKSLLLLAPRASPPFSTPSGGEGGEGQQQQQPSALLIECDGVAIDTAADAHRVAFNRAFAELGMDCTSWTPSLYNDLVRTGDGTGEGLVAVYFQTVGWPTMLATADRRPFAKRIHELKKKHLRLLAENGEIPLRKGVIDLIDEALGNGVRVGVLAGTQSAPEDLLGQAALRALGRERDVSVFNVPASAGGGSGFDSDDDDDDEGPSPSSSDAPKATTTTMEAGFAAAAAKLKAQGAAALVRSVAASRAAAAGGDDDGENSVLIDPALLAASRRNVASGLSSTWLAATAAALGVRGARCAVVAANSATLEAARGAGMVAIAAPPRAGRALGEYPMAQAVCDGFGAGGGVTWRRVAALVEKNVELVEAAAREAERRGKL